MSDYRILVSGSRSWSSPGLLTYELAMAAGRSGVPRDEIVIVHGGAPGADTMAAGFAAAHGYRAEEHRAHWTAPCHPTCKPGHRRTRRHGSTYCPAAGNYRNQDMVDAGANVALMFFEPTAANTGTSDCTRRALAAAIPVKPFGEVPDWVKAAEAAGLIEAEDYDCPTCGALVGERCRRLVQDRRTHAVRRATETDPPQRAAEAAHIERRRLAERDVDATTRGEN